MNIGLILKSNNISNLNQEKFFAKHTVDFFLILVVYKNIRKYFYI
jgi:hypothetical protein